MEETISKESQSPGYLVSEFTGVRSKKSQTISIKQYLDKVRSDEFKEKVLRHRLLRQQPGHEAEAQAIKSKMPCIIPAGICQGRHAASQLVQLSLITSVDLDDTNERTDEIFESLKELPYLKVLHRSISGTGLKAFLCISISNPDQYRAIYAAVSAEISQYAQHPCDKKCKDITRPCFYSWDPEAYYNPTATSYSLPEATAAEEEGTPNVAKFHPLSSTAPGATPAEGDNPAAPGFLAQFVSDFEHRNPFMRGERNDIALKLGRASRSKGFSSEELESIISVFSKHWSNSDFTADDIRKRVQAGYQFVNKQQSSEKSPFQGSQGSRFTMNPPRQERASEDEDVLLENNNKLRSAAPYFPEEVYLHLPRFLQECVKYAANPREKDIMLLGSLNNCSACLPGTRFIYKNAEHSTHFYSAVPASAAAGKSAIGFTSYLMDAIQEHYDRLRRKQKKEFEKAQLVWEKEQHAAFREKRCADINLKPEEPKYIYIKISPTTSKSRLIEHLRDSGELGCCMTSTEIGTLISAIGQDYGKYTDILCKAFHHEEISSSYKVDGDPIIVHLPRLALNLSGTQEQFILFFISLEDGLYSRFVIYTREAEWIWETCAPMDDQTDLRSYYRKLGEQLLEMHLHLLDFPTQVTFTAEQWKEHTRQFTEMLNSAIVEGKDAPGGIVFRHGLFAMRIAALLTVFRKWEDYKFAKEYCCTDEDFNTAMLITRTLIEHSLLMSTALPSTVHPPVAMHKYHRLTGIIHNLTNTFTFSAFMQEAERHGLSLSSAKRLLKKAVDLEFIVKQEDNYKKRK